MSEKDQKIIAIIADVLQKDESELTEEKRLVDDLGADSIDLFDLVMAFEDEFEIEVPDEELEGIKTIGDIMQMVEDRTA